MHYTAPEVLLIIAAISSLLVNTITAWRQSGKLDAIKEQGQQGSVKFDLMAVKTAAIEAHVNGEKTAAEGRESTLRKENDLLRAINQDFKTQNSLLVQAAAVRAATDAVLPIPRSARSSDGPQRPSANGMRLVDTPVAAVPPTEEK